MTSTDFIITKEYQRFEEFCDACFSEKYIGICYGAPGVGKTISAKHYSKWNHYEQFVKSQLSNEERTQLNRQLRTDKAIYYTVPVVNNPRQIEKDLGKWRLRKQVSVYESQ